MIARAAAFIRRWYFAFVVFLFVFSPEMRRVADYYTSVHKLSPFSVLPTIALVIAIFFTASRWKLVGTTFRTISTIWLGAFGIALAIGWFSGSPLAAGYDLLEFCSPIMFGLILSMANEELMPLYRRVAGAILAFSAIASCYAIYQYVAPPAWDVFWVLNSGLVSTGSPEPFGLRVFGPLNSYSAFAHFTALTMILNLPRLGRERWRSVLAYVPSTIALLLTSDRTAWIAFTLGLLFFLATSPRRTIVLKSLGLTVLIGTVISATLLFSIKGSDDVLSLLQQRFATLTDIRDDASFADRQQQTRHALRLGLGEPLGQGLGSVGSAAIAGASGETVTLDNGYLSRLVELGVLGFVAYLVVVVGAFFLGWGAYRRSLADADSANAGYPSLLSASLAIQLMLVWIDFSSDSHAGILGMFFWLSLYNVSAFCVVSRRRTPVRARRVLREAAAS